MEDNKTTPQPSADDFSIPVTVGTPQPKPSSAPDLPSETSAGADITSLPVAEPSDDSLGQPSAPVFSDVKPAASEMPSPTESSLAGAPSAEPPRTDWTPLAQEQVSASPTAPGTGKSLAELASEEEAKNPVAEPQSALHPTKKHGKGRIVLVAVLLLLSLAGGAGYAYYQQKKGTPAPVTSNTEAKTTTTSNTADTDQTAKDIDESLQKVDDTKEFSENDLSDTSIGLQ